MKNSKELYERRRNRTRGKVRRNNTARPRLTVFRSGKHIYAQVIDDAKGVTLASASSLEKEVLGSLKSGAGVEAAGQVGKIVAERAKSAGVESIVFDRGGYLYHGRVKALAEAARESGLSF